MSARGLSSGAKSNSRLKWWPCRGTTPPKHHQIFIVVVTFMLNLAWNSDTRLNCDTAILLMSRKNFWRTQLLTIGNDHDRYSTGGKWGVNIRLDDCLLILNRLFYWIVFETWRGSVASTKLEQLGIMKLKPRIFCRYTSQSFSANKQILFPHTKALSTVDIYRIDYIY